MKWYSFREMEARAKRLEYSGITLGAVLIMAFVLVQPTMNQAYAVGLANGLPGYDDCFLAKSQPEDPISMNTVRSGSIVKTIHAEKEIFFCDLDQGNLPVIVDVTTYVEIYENIDSKKVIETNAVATTCIKEPSPLSSGGATVIDCESYDIPTTPVFVGNNCEEFPAERGITHPQEMNTVNKGKIAKTIEAQKEVFICGLDELEPEVFNVGKKVDIILFTETYEDLSTQTVLETQFHAMRCVVLESDEFILEPDNDLPDATVETCQFSSIEN